MHFLNAIPPEFPMFLPCLGMTQVERPLAPEFGMKLLVDYYLASLQSVKDFAMHAKRVARRALSKESMRSTHFDHDHAMATLLELFVERKLTVVDVVVAVQRLALQ